MLSGQGREHGKGGKALVGRCPAGPTSRRIFGMRSTASGGGPGSLIARRQAVMRSGSQRLRSGTGSPAAPPPGGAQTARARVERPRYPRVQRGGTSPGTHSQRPRSAFHQQTETALGHPIFGRSSLHSRQTSPCILRGERPDGATASTFTGTSCARVVAQNHGCFRPPGSGRPPPLRSDGDAPKSRAPARAKAGLDEAARRFFILASALA